MVATCQQQDGAEKVRYKKPFFIGLCGRRHEKKINEMPCERSHQPPEF